MSFLSDQVCSVGDYICASDSSSPLIDVFVSNPKLPGIGTRKMQINNVPNSNNKVGHMEAVGSEIVMMVDITLITLIALIALITLSR